MIICGKNHGIISENSMNQSLTHSVTAQHLCQANMTFLVGFCPFHCWKSLAFHVLSILVKTNKRLKKTKVLVCFCFGRVVAL